MKHPFVSICILLIVIHAASQDGPVDLAFICKHLKLREPKHWFEEKLQGVSLGAGNRHLYLMVDDHLYRIPYNRHYFNWNPPRMALFDQSATGHRLESFGSWKQLPSMRRLINQLGFNDFGKAGRLYRFSIIAETKLKFIIGRNRTVDEHVLIQCRPSFEAALTSPDAVNFTILERVYVSHSGWTFFARDCNVSDYRAKQTFYFKNRNLNGQLRDSSHWVDASGVSSDLYISNRWDHADGLYITHVPKRGERDFEDSFKTPIFGFITPRGRVQMWREDDMLNYSAVAPNQAVQAAAWGAKLGQDPATLGAPAPSATALHSYRVYTFTYSANGARAVLHYRTVWFADYFVCSPNSWTPGDSRDFEYPEITSSSSHSDSVSFIHSDTESPTHSGPSGSGVPWYVWTLLVGVLLLLLAGGAIFAFLWLKKARQVSWKQKQLKTQKQSNKGKRASMSTASSSKGKSSSKAAPSSSNSSRA